MKPFITHGEYQTSNQKYFCQRCGAEYMKPSRPVLGIHMGKSYIIRSCDCEARSNKDYFKWFLDSGKMSNYKPTEGRSFDIVVSSEKIYNELEKFFENVESQINRAIRAEWNGPDIDLCVWADINSIIRALI